MNNFTSVVCTQHNFFFYSCALQQKYFDSGDYNMAQAKMKNKPLPVAGSDKNLVTGDHIPTPEDLPPRKYSLVTSKLVG